MGALEELFATNAKTVITRVCEPSRRGVSQANHSNAVGSQSVSTGKVYIVGAGPGDPELLTMRAFQVLHEGELVFHDDLVSQEILDCINPSAHIQNVGKRCGTKSISQNEINELMIQGARAGFTVVRIKSGDSLVFGRAAEEIRALRRANVSFEIVPGITSALAAAAALQISLTEREVSSHVVFSTAHQVAEQRTGWAGLPRREVTFVVYMPGGNYAQLQQQLTDAGFSPEMPCAVISCASLETQSAACTNVGELHQTPRLPAPSLVIVGEVCRDAKTEQVEGLAPALGISQSSSKSSLRNIATGEHRGA